MPRPNSDPNPSSITEKLGYEAAFYSLPDPVFVYDHSNRRIVLSNEAAVARYGYSENEFQKMGPWDIEAPYIKAELIPRIDRLREQGSAVYRTEHRNKRGETFPVEMHTIYRELDQREIFIAVCRGLTERLDTERRLDKAETHYRAIFENTISLICVADLQTGYYLDVNPAFETTLGYDKEELLSTPLVEFIHPEDRARSERLVETLLEEKQIQCSFQNRVMHKDGHYVWLDWSSRPLPEKGLVYALAQDISERKWFEEELRAQNQRMRLHVEQTPLGVIEWGLDFRITEWNQAATQIFGYTREEAVGQPGSIIIDPETQEKTKEVWARLVSNRGGKRSINQNQHKDGSKRICEWHNTSLVDQQGKIIGVASLVHDVTESQRQKEELQRAKVAAEKANQAKSEFLAMMSHELRTPLNSIVGPCELLKLQTDDDAKAPLVDIMLASSTHLLELINSILDLAKIESGSLEPKRETLDIDSFFSGRLLPLASSAKKKGLEYTLDNRAPRNSALNTDGQLLLQVLFNIIGNAIKFTESGSIKVSLDSIGSSLRISISDTGSGIPKSEQKSLFEPFRQGRDSLSKTQRGSGLGLAISKHIIELLDGKIEFESDTANGTRFYITLPGLEKPHPSPVEKTKVQDVAPATQPAPSKILLVEDEPNNKLVTSAILKHLQCPHDIAESGEEAIELWQAKRYPIVLMDVKLPKMDGIEATRRIKQLANDSPVWIVAQSAYALTEQKDRFLAQGMDDYISKPISIPSLRAVLERADRQIGSKR
ncbi:PAS domain S-box protein [Pelagicoccus enzymogenes]|uniref:PAS domain S-box protein n=1 Tax=Pelagicoccus enzymogenes TaxID=2773457 RepID=UPI00280D2A84|nr:PAS domain S-box protein [Pelagicoccus enzymogenes]MDQ8196845.1 PAS domain S-box protein [Pelagicoccus enzymogenes]